MEEVVSIKKGYTLHTIYKDGFKNNVIKIIYKDKYNKDIITHNNLLLDCLTYSTKKYPTKRELLRKYEYLYDAYIRGKISRIGKNVLTTFSLDFLDPKYCEDGYLEEVIEILFDIVNHPNINGNKFDEKTFNIAKFNYQSYLESIKENPNSYAYSRALYHFDKDSLCSISMDGDLEVLKSIKNEDLIKYYKHLINETECHIYVSGNLDMDKVANIIDKYINRKDNRVDNDLVIINKKRNKVLNVEESGPYKQDILYIIYNIDELSKYESEVVLPIYNYILGSGGLTSKLYDKVREKNSLCYSIRSSYNFLDKIMYVHAGINKKDKDLVVKLISECFMEMVNGKFTKKELEDTKKYYIHSLDNANNSVNRIIGYYSSNYFFGAYMPDEMKVLYKKVTKEDVVKVAKKIKINTVYLLGGES